MNNSTYQILEYNKNRYQVKETTENNKVIFHTANDYGFKTKDAANRFINYHKNKEEIENKKKEIRDWWNEHRALGDCIGNEQFIICYKDHDEFKKSDFERCLKWYNLSLKDLPCSWTQMLKYS